VDDETRAVILMVPLGDAGREEDLLRRLGLDLKELGEVEFEYAQDESGENKGGGALAWVSVVLSAGRGLRDLLRVVGDWARSGRTTIRVRVGKDYLDMTNVTREQQDIIIEEFFARHPRQ
jgi:hypothetical protein